MDRRDFIKNGLLGLGALSLGGVTGELLARPTASVSPSAKASEEGASVMPFRSAMMQGCVNMPGTLLEKFRAVRAAGFAGIEPFSHENRNEVLEALAETGLEAADVCYGKSWQWSLSSADEAVREQGVEGLIHAMEDAQAYGTDTVLLVPGVVNAQTGYDLCWERSTACIRKALPEAERLGVRIAVENVWNNFLLSPLEAARYVDQFESPWVGFYFDVGNILTCGWPAQWIRILGKRILRIHIKDYSRALAYAKGSAGEGFEVVLGEGDNDWPAVTEALRSHYRHGWLTIEHAGGDTPEGLAALAQTLSRIASQ